MVNKIDLLSDGEFIELINNSSSTADVLRSLDYSVKGNSWAYQIVAERMNKLNLDTFNDILFGALKDQSVEGQIKLLKAELNMVVDMLFSETAELLDELEQCGYESERFTRIKNIKSNSEGLLLKLKGLEKKLKAGVKNE